MRERRILPTLLLILALIVVACGVPTGDGAETEPSTTSSPTTSPSTTSSSTTSAPDTATTTTLAATTVVTAEDGSIVCPVTIPPQPGFEARNPDDAVYSEHFPEPDPPPTEYPHEGMVWYGSEELWTVLPLEGAHIPRKSAWWSVNFPGGLAESEPEMVVTWTRLDTDTEVVIDNGGQATNAYTPEEGWFIIGGRDPNETGCWKVEATYKGATLSYVYEVSQ